MIINISLGSFDKGKKRRLLKFIDCGEEYNVLLVIEEHKAEGWEQGEIQILGYANKLDMKRLGKAS